MNSRLSLTLLLGLLTIFTLTSCSAATPKLSITLTTDKNVYAAEDPVGLALTVLNLNKRRDYEAKFSSGQKYDFSLYDTQGNHVWSWSAGQMFIQSLTQLTLTPNKPRTFMIVWDQNLLSGQRIAAGKYKLVGSFKLRDQKINSNEMELEFR